MPLFNPPLQVQDEGIVQGNVTAVNFTGSAVTASVSSNTGTIAITSTGGSTPTAIEVDIGQISVYTKVINIIDASISTSSKILAWQDGTAPTGRSSDENEMDALICSGTPKIGSFDLIISAVPGPIVGLYKILYIVT